MTVRVWMKPNELGDRGYFIAFDRADGYEVHDDGTLLLFSGEGDEPTQVGLVSPERWDAAQLLEEESVDGD